MSNGPITSVRTPEFGACMDKGTSSSDRCVLSKTSCDASGTEIYRAPYETDLSCKVPEDVQVGRCKSSLDDERCGPTEGSCGTRSPFYAMNDPKCSLVADKSVDDGTRTTFPACSTVGTNEHQCVLDESYCLDGERFDYAKWAEEWGPNPCYCEDVPTGVCYQAKTTNGENNLTPKYSFCAVSQRDCPSDYLWMSARAFLKNDGATYECRLCDENKIGNEGSFPVGGCLEIGASSASFDAANVENCALESVACPGTTEFVSSQRLSELALYCPMERTKNWGTCNSSGDPVECTNKEASCRYDFKFVSDGSVCDVFGHPETGLPTYFSFCSPRTDNDDKDWREIRCVWGEYECDPAKERWEEARLPNNDWFNGCTCEDVFTGVCKEPSTGEYHCAVSPQACTDPASYVSERNLNELEIDMTCQLCVPRPPTAPPITPVPSPTMIQQPVPVPTRSSVVADRPTLPPIPWPTRAPWSTEAPKSTITKIQIQNKNLPPGAIAGIAIGGLVVCGLIVLIINMIAGRGTTSSPTLVSDPQGDEETNDPEIFIEEPDHNQDLVASTATIT